MKTLETLTRRRLGLPLVLLFGLCVFYPAVRAPLFLDDFVHAAMVEGTFVEERGPFDLYDFFDADNHAVLLERGLIPWWADPRLTLRFFRPLSSALLWLQHAAFSHAALPMHLHSLAWWALGVLAVRALFRRFFSERVALLGTAIYALSPCHALPLAWIANSEVLIALAFGALALRCHMRCRIEAPLAGSSLRDLALAPLLFTLAILAGGEYALAFGGYVLALELSVRRRTRSLGAHVVGVLPFAVPALCYLVARSALGYGVVGSGFYADPLREPAAFFRSAPSRFVALVADGWLTLGSGAWQGLARWALAGVVLAVAVALFVPIRRALGALEAESNVAARTFLWGSLLSLIPTLAVVPAFRLLGVGMIGVAAVSALVIDRAWFPPEEAPSRGAAVGTAMALVLAFAQLVHGPVMASLASRIHRRDGEDFAKRAAWVAAHVGDLSQADVGVVRGMAGSFFLPFALELGGQAPRRWRVLAHSGHVLVLRTAPMTLELVFAADRSAYPVDEHNLYRAPTSPLRVGDVVRAGGMTVTILEVGTMGPRRVRFDFEDSPSAVTWIAETYRAMAGVELPAVGHGAPYDP